MQAQKIFRAFLGMGGWSILAFFALIGNVAVFWSNYMGLTLSFYLLGYDTQPIFQDEFIGPLASGYFDKANASHLFSFAIAAVMSVMIFGAARLLCRALANYSDIQTYKRIDKANNAAYCASRMKLNLLLAAALFLPLVPVIFWDMHLLRLRVMSGALGLTTPEQAVQMLNWSLLSEKHNHLYSYYHAKIGVFGYLGFTAGAAIGFEVFLHKLGESFNQFCTDIGQWWSGSEDISADSTQAEVFPEHVVLDEERTSIHDSEISPPYQSSENSIEVQESQECTNDRECHDEECEVDDDNLDRLPSPTLSSTAVTDGDDPEGSIRPGTRESDSSFDPFDSPDPADTSSSPNEDSQLYEVIGDPNNRTISRAEAFSNRDQYHVDMTSNTIFDRAFYEKLNEIDFDDSDISASTWLDEDTESTRSEE